MAEGKNRSIEDAIEVRLRTAASAKMTRPEVDDLEYQVSKIRELTKPGQ